MKNVVRTLAVIGCITGAANECFAAGLLNLSKSQVQKVTYNDTSKGTCGLVKNKWVPVKKVTGGYKKLSNASAALKSACSSLLKTGKLKSLSDLPDVSKLGATNISAAAISAVSGTPPALVDINGLGVKNVFWAPGIVDALNNSTADVNECTQFFYSHTDGGSSGLFGCFQAEGVAMSLQNASRSGDSFCYMKNAPTKANLDAGGISVVSGNLPNNDITKLFAPPSGDSNRLVKVTVAGAPEGQSGGGGGGGGGGQDGAKDIFIKVFSTGNNASKGLRYHYQLFECESGDDHPRHVEDASVSLSGLFQSANKGSEQGDGMFQSSVKAFVTTGEDGKLTFNTSMDRTADVQFKAGDNSRSFKAHVVIGADNLISTKAYDTATFGSFSAYRKAYSVNEVAGEDTQHLALVQGAYKDSHLFSGSTPENVSMAMEYRDNYYVVNPTSDMLAQLDEVDLGSDSFYTNSASNSFDSSGIDCAATPDIEVSMDMSNSTLQAAVAECAHEKLDDMHFCNDSEVRQAQENFVPVCIAH